MTLSDISHIFVLAEVDESDIGLVADPADGGGPAGGDYGGCIPERGLRRPGGARGPQGGDHANVTTFEVKIEVTSANRKLLRPEMTATAKIIVASRPDVLSIPVSAFRRADPGEYPQAAARAMPACRWPW